MTHPKNPLAEYIAFRGTPECSITPRERQIIAGLAADLSAKMIAVQLDLSCHTVQQHIKNIKQKFGLCTSAGIVAMALREGIIG